MRSPQLGYQPRHVVIGKIARLFQLKGHEYLLRARAGDRGALVPMCGSCSSATACCRELRQRIRRSRGA